MRGFSRQKLTYRIVPVAYLSAHYGGLVGSQKKLSKNNMVEIIANYVEIIQRIVSLPIVSRAKAHTSKITASFPPAIFW